MTKRVNIDMNMDEDADVEEDVIPNRVDHISPVVSPRNDNRKCTIEFLSDQSDFWPRETERLQVQHSRRGNRSEPLQVEAII